MSDIVLDVQSASATPAAGQIVIFPETGGKRLTFKDDAGRTYTLGEGCIRNQSNAVSGAGFAVDTYVAGSNITVPASLTLQVGSQYRCKISLSKTAAGVATPICNVRVGTLGTTADAAMFTFTGAIQTAAADVGFIEVLFTVNTIGATGTMRGTYVLKHNVASGAGLSGTDIIEQGNGSFNTTTASLIIGISLNFGTAASVITTQVEAELLNI